MLQILIFPLLILISLAPLILMIKLCVSVHKMRKEISDAEHQIFTLRKLVFELKNKFENAESQTNKGCRTQTQQAIQCENIKPETSPQAEKISTIRTNSNLQILEPKKTQTESSLPTQKIENPELKRQNFTNKLLVFIGALALMFAGFFLIKYSIERNLFSPEMRILSGAIFAIITGGVSSYFLKKSKSKELPNSLMGVAIATLFADIFAANTIYSLIPSSIAFAGVAGVFAFTFFVSKYYTRLFLPFAIFGVIIAPLVIKSDTPNVVALLSYIFAANFAALSISKKFKNIACALLYIISTCFWTFCAIRLAKCNFDYYAIFTFVGTNIAIAIACSQYIKNKIEDDFKFKTPLARAFDIFEILILLELSINMSLKCEIHLPSLVFASAILLYSMFEKSWEKISVILPFAIAISLSAMKLPVEIKDAIFLAYIVATLAVIPFRFDTTRLAVIAFLFSLFANEAQLLPSYALPSAILIYLSSCKFWRNPNEFAIGALNLIVAYFVLNFQMPILAKCAILTLNAALIYAYNFKMLKVLFLLLVSFVAIPIFCDLFKFVLLSDSFMLKTQSLQCAFYLVPFALLLIALNRKSASDKLSQITQIATVIASVLTLSASVVSTNLHVHLKDAIICGIFGFTTVVLSLENRENMRIFKIFAKVFFAFTLLKMFIVSPLNQNVILYPIKVCGIPIFNDFALSYLAPALFAIALLFAKSKNLDKFAKFALGTLGGIALFFYINSQIRFCFAGEFLNDKISSLENYTYSITWIFISIILYFLNAKFGIKMLYIAFLSLVGITCLKIFLIDSANLDGILRVLSFAILGISLLIPQRQRHSL